MPRSLSRETISTQVAAELARKAPQMVLTTPHQIDAQWLQEAYRRRGWWTSAARGSRRNGAGHTFEMLGFTHLWGKSRAGRWVVKRKTAKDASAER